MMLESQSPFVASLHSRLQQSCAEVSGVSGCCCSFFCVTRYINCAVALHPMYPSCALPAQALPPIVYVRWHP